MDFQQVPGFAAKVTSTFENPYFMLFMNMFIQSNFPHINELPIWLWICCDKETQLQIHHLAGHEMVTTKYMKKFSTYVLVEFKRVDDLPTMHKNARAPIPLIFLVWHVDKDRFNIPAEFKASNILVYTKPRVCSTVS